MKQKIVKSLMGDLICLGILIFALSRINFICLNAPLAAYIIPAIWFLYGLKFLFKKDFYNGVIEYNLLVKWGTICIIIGFFSFIFVMGSVFKF